MKFMLRKLLPVALVSMLLAGLSGWAVAADSKDPIILPTHNWSSQIVMSYVVGKLFEKLGDNVEYKPADSQAVYESIRRGDVTVSMEVWQSTFGKSFNEALDKGGIIDAGTHTAKTREEWWYPAYVTEFCPGLPSWEALNACAETFSSPETAPLGRYLDGPADWHGQETKDRIEALKMDYKAVFAGSAAALWAELEAAKKNNKPIVLFNWSPNFTDALYGGDFIEFPEYYEGCRKEDGGDGVCGSPPAGWLKKAAYYQMPKKWPAAYKLLTRIDFDKVQIATMAKLVDIDGLEHEEAADKWLADNEAAWKPWLKD